MREGGLRQRTSLRPQLGRLRERQLFVGRLQQRPNLRDQQRQLRPRSMLERRLPEGSGLHQGRLPDERREATDPAEQAANGGRPLGRDRRRWLLLQRPSSVVVANLAAEPRTFEVDAASVLLASEDVEWRRPALTLPPESVAILAR